MTTHVLKIWPEFYEAVKSGRMTYQVRRSDRDFKKGDVVVLREFNPDANDFVLSPSLIFEIGEVTLISIMGKSLFAAFALLPLKFKAAQPTPEPAPTPAPYTGMQEIAGRCMLSATASIFGGFKADSTWQSWETCDSKSLFVEAGETFIKNLGREALAQMDGKGGAA